MYVRSTQLDKHQMGMAEVLRSIITVINILLLNFFHVVKPLIPIMPILAIVCVREKPDCILNL